MCRRKTRQAGDSSRELPQGMCVPWRHGYVKRRARCACGPLRTPRAIVKAERPDMADSFIVCWQFCLRFGSEVVELNSPNHSEVTTCTDKGAPQVCIQFRQRKGCANPDPASRAPMCAGSASHGGGSRAGACAGVAKLRLRAAGAQALRRVRDTPAPAPGSARVPGAHLHGSVVVRQNNGGAIESPSGVRMGDSLLPAGQGRPGPKRAGHRACGLSLARRARH